MYTRDYVITLLADSHSVNRGRGRSPPQQYNAFSAVNPRARLRVRVARSSCSDAVMQSVAGNAPRPREWL
jgi:hypothetical protein